MSRRALTWVLWLVFVCTVPLPYFMIESGRVPAAQLFILAAMTTPLAITDPSITTRVVAALFVAQSLLYGGLLYALAGWSARRIERYAESRARALTVVVLAALLVTLALFNVYRAPLSHGPGTTNIFGVFM